MKDVVFKNGTLSVYLDVAPDQVKSVLVSRKGSIYGEVFLRSDEKNAYEERWNELKETIEELRDNNLNNCKGKYEYHYDHTDCIWYRPEARNRCPATCAQYRDGWNDAMNYIFKDGAGYRPFRRDKKYEG